jgi:hypothetical protein
MAKADATAFHSPASSLLLLPPPPPSAAYDGRLRLELVGTPSSAEDEEDDGEPPSSLRRSRMLVERLRR